MVLLVVTTVLTIALTYAGMAYGRRRPPGTFVSWGEAMVAATFAFFVMFLAYGVVPHQWLTWADNELNWRADTLLLGPASIFAKLPFALTYQVLRDIVAAVIYIVFLGVQIALWSVWQNRGKTKPKELETSPYGRPLVRRA